MSTPPKSPSTHSLTDQLADLHLEDSKMILQNAMTAYSHEELHTTSSLSGGGGTEYVKSSVHHEADTATANIISNLEKLGFYEYVRAFVATAEKPLERLPCANVKPAKNWKCKEDGRSACSECKVVSYCSKECQRVHWPKHKKDCKDPIRSPLWRPSWTSERRIPTFIQESHEIPRNEREFALGLHLWGNVPAVDTLNLPKNEGASATKSNIALAYVASGDLRNVVRTVNELPSDYSGELTILMNDLEPMIVLRNMLLLMILGTIEDSAEAADIALHLWCSAFVQEPHDVLHSQVIVQILSALQPDKPFSFKLGEHSVMTGSISDRTIFWFVQIVRSKLQPREAQEEMRRVRFEPSRRDRHDRYYMNLNSSHRLASLEYRRSGIILPFGASNHVFNTPNRFLFAPDGRWLQNDLVSPLGSWNIEDVIKAGKDHGAQSADLYGCLYFYLSGQFRSFAERVRKFRISFRMFDQDARDLAIKLRSGTYQAQGLPKNVLFDRIDVSNIIDAEYVGISNVLADWTPFLSKTNRCATLLAYSMNWIMRQYDGQPQSDAKIGMLTKKLIVMGKITPSVLDAAHVPAMMKYMTVVYDNSIVFDQYLKKQGADEAACKAGSRLKSKHTIVPHRIGAPLDGPSNALPQFTTEDSWYWNVQVCSGAHSERFVEYARI